MDFFKLARCRFCKSIWVCWNWIHPFGGDLKKMAESNPHLSPEDIKDSWCHECWVCGDAIGGSCFETEHKVTNGIPYWLLKLSGEWRWGALPAIQKFLVDGLKNGDAWFFYFAFTIVWLNWQLGIHLYYMEVICRVLS